MLKYYVFGNLNECTSLGVFVLKTVGIDQLMKKQTPTQMEIHKMLKNVFCLFREHISAFSNHSLHWIEQKVQIILLFS